MFKIKNNLLLYMRLLSNSLFHNMGNPPCYDLTHMNLSDNLINSESLTYNHKIKLLEKYLSSLPKEKVFHDNKNSNLFNGEIRYHLDHILSFLNNKHPILEGHINIEHNGERLNNIFNKYNDKKLGYPGSDNIVFQYNKINNRLQINKIYFDGLIYKLSITNKEFNTHHIDTNMIIIKKKDTLFSIRYNDLDRNDLDKITWKKLDNIQDFTLRKNELPLNAVIDDFDKLFYIHLNDKENQSLKDNSLLTFKNNHNNALIGQKYTYNEEGIMIFYFKETGIAILEGARKKRIPIKIPICKPFRFLVGTDTNFNADGFYMCVASISHTNYKTRNLENKNIKQSKCSVIRNTIDEYEIYQKEYPHQLIQSGQSKFLDNIFLDNNLTRYLNVTKLYSLFYLFYRQYPLEKIDTPPKKIYYTKLTNIKDIVGTHKVGGFYWIKKENSCYLPIGTMFLPSESNSDSSELESFSDIYEKDETILVSKYKSTNPLFEYYPDNSLISYGAYLTSLYSSNEIWYVDFITDNNFYRQVELSNINITQNGLELLNNIQYIITPDKLSIGFNIQCKPFMKIKCKTNNVNVEFIFKGHLSYYHFGGLKNQFKWVDAIKFDNNTILLKDFINLNKKLSKGSYLWNNDDKYLYWIPDNKWEFHKFYEEIYEIDLQSIMLYLLEKQKEDDGNTRKQILDKFTSNNKSTLKLNATDVKNIVKLLK